MSIKLITIDLDGTLFNSKGVLTSRVKTTLLKAQEKGIKIILNTGRSLSGEVLELLDELNLTDEGNYVATYNGALVQDIYNKKKIIHHTLNIADYYKIEKLAEELGVHFHTISEDNIYTANSDIHWLTVREAYLAKLSLYYVTPGEMNKDIEIGKMMIIDEVDLIEESIKKIPEEFYKNYSIFRSSPYFLEFLNKKASKGTAVEELGKYLNINREEIMAIGDNENDLDMIKFAGIGVAMGNSSDFVKKAADIVTKTNDEDGVACVIEEYCF